MGRRSAIDDFDYRSDCATFRPIEAIENEVEKS